MCCNLKLLAVLLLITPAAYASEIVSTTTGTGEVAYLVNCTTPCTVKLYDFNNALIGEANHTGLDWGSFTAGTAAMYNLTLWENATLVDSKTVNMGVFNTTFPEKLESRVGKEVVGLAILLSTGLSSILLGLEGGAIVFALALITTAQAGYLPGGEWVLSIIYLVAGIAAFIGLYLLIGGMR